MRAKGWAPLDASCALMVKGVLKSSGRWVGAKCRGPWVHLMPPYWPKVFAGMPCASLAPGIPRSYSRCLALKAALLLAADAGAARKARYAPLATLVQRVGAKRLLEMQVNHSFCLLCVSALKPNCFF